MKIYTSYFAVVNKLSTKVKPVSIALYNPKWLKGIPHLAVFAPTQGIKNMDEEHYKPAFQREILDQIKIDDIRLAFDKLSDQGKYDLALICYEKPPQFCHRHLVADWLRQHGIDVEEYNTSNQGNLF